MSKRLSLSSALCCVAVTSTCSPRGGAAVPHSSVPLARLTVQKIERKKKKVVEPLQKRGSFWMLLLEIRCSLCGLWREQAGSASAGFRGEWSWAHNFSPVLLLLLLLLLEFPLGFSSCDKNELDFTSSTNMYSVALLLMLAVRIYADSMEGPTGKRRKKPPNKCVSVFLEAGKRTVRICTAPRRYKVDCQGFKVALPLQSRHI